MGRDLEEDQRYILHQIAEAAKREKQLQDMKDRDEVFDFIKALAGSAAGAGVARSLTGILGDFIKDDIKNSFRRK